jgi:hypothetical protein
MHRYDKGKRSTLAQKSPVFRRNGTQKGTFWGDFSHQWLMAKSLRETISQNLTTTSNLFLMEPTGWR